MSGSGGVIQLLLCALCTLLSLGQRGALPSGGGGPLNITLLFDSVSHGGHSLRNCSCASEIQDCNDALANLLCSCRTVPRSALPPAGLAVRGGLTVWVRDAWVLRELLNGSAVQDLRLSACGPAPFSAQPLTLFGLRRLRLHSASQDATHPEQTLNIATGQEQSRGRGGRPSSSSSSFSSSSSSSSPFLVSFLDVALLNGLSPLKAYSVSSPPTPILAQHFPHLPLAHTIPTQQPPEPLQDCLLTFIY
ncbi:exosomal polycystin-1-interacting protein-like [Anguilla rostrata]|uniref:exosomal polycystin-1-interacting protein-like n=1 Tax=Anguilla rostrata TaxID=7938 RepID=UPI0030D5574D